LELLKLLKDLFKRVEGTNQGSQEIKDKIINSISETITHTRGIPPINSLRERNEFQNFPEERKNKRKGKSFQEKEEKRGRMKPSKRKGERSKIGRTKRKPPNKDPS